ncbi:MAG TPA: nucleotide exchange factor GrpE [Candidatus Acidoferrales bacterium]|nr:nucleotide exchange factor GrpE [Candidatus Acidoferrales bacterium]
MAEPKREGERVIPIDGGRGDRDAESPLAAGENAAADPAQSPTDELSRLKAEKDELMQTMIRRQADFENFRKRTERDRQEEGRRGVERLIIDLIPVLDGFDRALQAHAEPAYEEYRKGVTLIRKQLWETLAKHGVQRIDATGKIFDPHQHQAIERLESEEYPDGAIVAVFQDGYTFHGRVLRPAIVRVAVNPSEGGKHSNSDGN